MVQHTNQTTTKELATLALRVVFKGNAEYVVPQAWGAFGFFEKALPDVAACTIVENLVRDQMLCRT